MQRIRALIIASRKSLPVAHSVIGNSADSVFGDSEAENYIELLSASNIPFELKYIDELSDEDFIHEGVIYYSTLVLCVDERQLPERILQTVKTISSEYGVSIIGSYVNCRSRLAELFGISATASRKLRFPCKLLINRDYFQGYDVEDQIPLGYGWRIPIQKWGLRRHPWRFLKKHLKLIFEQPFTYLRVSVLASADVHASISGTDDPAIICNSYGKATNYYLSLQSNRYLNRFGSLHRILRDYIAANKCSGGVFMDFKDTMILRMDDPGTCERVYLKNYDSELMSQAEWQSMLDLLQNYDAQLSIMYIPLWLDDGSSSNGDLYIDGELVTERKPGSEYLSYSVVFHKNVGDGKIKVYDYGDEYSAIKQRLTSGVLDIESHGLTHVDTNREKWASAGDRYTNLNWYHEFRHVPENRDVSSEEQIHSLQESARLISQYFGNSPSSITPSGHEQSANSESLAHQHGYKVFSSEYHSYRSNGLTVRNDKIQSLFMESTPASEEFANSGYPVAGVFHDYEIKNHGLEWLSRNLEDWKCAGKHRFITLREFAGYVCSSLECWIDDDQFCIEVDISNTGSVTGGEDGRYFADHEMRLSVHLPAGTSVENIRFNDTSWENFVPEFSDLATIVRLPGFGIRQTQKVELKLMTRTGSDH